MRRFAIIGSGPAGFYTAEALLKTGGGEAAIDIVDRLPTPYGLVRSGVAPDHQSLKAVANRFEKVALDPAVRFVGNVAVGRDVAVGELLEMYDAVVLATGAPRDRPLDIPGADLPGVWGSAAFVGWYNGHPDFAEHDPPLDAAGAAVIGNGNVALDVARILAKTRDEFHGSDIVGRALDALEASAVRRITIVGRRGPHQIGMTPKELGELAHLEAAASFVDPADLPPEADDAGLDPGTRKSAALLRAFAVPPAAPASKTIAFDFFARPVAIEGDGRVERLVVERTRLDADGRVVGTGEIHAHPCGLVVAAIGYRTAAIDGVPYDAAAGRFANFGGRIDMGNAGLLYAVGWARRGPSGTIGTNRPDGYEVAERIAAELGDRRGDAPGRAGGAGLDARLAARGVDATGFADWRRIDASETKAARPGSPREKWTRMDELHAARRT